MQKKSSASVNNDIEGLRARVLELEQTEAELRRIETDLIREKEITARYLDIAGVIILVIGTDERVELINKMGCRILGYTREEIIGENWFDKFLPPDTIEHTRHVFFQLIKDESQNLDYFENDILTKSGETRSIAWHNSILRDSTGKIIGTLSSGEDITSRKQAEESLRRSEERFRMLVENLGEGIGIVDPQEYFIFANQAAEKLFGVSPGKLVGRNLSEFTSQEQFKTIQEQTLMRQQGANGLYEIDILQPNGHIRKVCVNATSHQKNGENLGAIEIFRDVTDSRKSEKILRESEERYRNIFDTAGVSIWEEDFSEVKRTIDELSRKGVKDFRCYIDLHPEFLEHAAKKIKIVDINKTTLSLFGAKTKDELLGSLDKIFVPDTFKILRDELVALAEGQTYFEGETINQNLAGENLDVLLTMAFPSDADKFDMVLVSMMDITDRKRAEKEIATQKARFQQLFENAPIGIATLDGQDRVQGINKAFEMIFQYREEDILGRKINELVVPPELSKEASSLSAATLEGASVQKETIRKRKDGSLVPVHAYGVPIILDGETVGVFAMYVDITDRKQKEQKLEYLSSHDALTGLNNRSFFEIEMDRLEREKQFPSSIIVGDVDGLKFVNDHSGHAAGDRLLKTSAELMRKAFRTSDVLARIGGDEFAVLLTGADAISANQALERVKNILESYNQDNPEIPINISFGVATAQRGKTLLQVFKEADQRMYEEKAIKRTKVNKTADSL